MVETVAEEVVVEAIEPQKKRRKLFVYRPSSDIIILKEVIAVNPFAAAFGKVMESWDLVAKNSQLDVSGQGVKSRVDLLMKARKKEEMANIKKSGTEEEYSEREQLVDEVIELEKLGQEESEKKKRKAHELTQQGEEIRDAALMSLGDEEKPSSSKKRKSNTTDDLLLAFIEMNNEKLSLEAKRLELREKEIELEKQRREDEREEKKQQMNLFKELVMALTTQK